MLEALQLPGGARTGVQPAPVPVGALADLVDVALQAGDVAVQVVDGDPGPGQLVLGRADGRLQRADLGVLGQGTAAVRELAQRGVDRLEVQQAALGVGVGLHGRGSSCGTCTVHGSVTRSETTVSRPYAPRT